MHHRHFDLLATSNRFSTMQSTRQSLGMRDIQRSSSTLISPIGILRRSSTRRINGYPKITNPAIVYFFSVSVVLSWASTRTHQYRLYDGPGFSRGAYQARVIAGMIETVRAPISFNGLPLLRDNHFFRSAYFTREMSDRSPCTWLENLCIASVDPSTQRL